MPIGIGKVDHDCGHPTEDHWAGGAIIQKIVDADLIELAF